MTAPTSTRGRPRTFDENQVLDALMGLFAVHGFEASSLADIVEVAGLNKSSLYNAFGSKEALFRKVLDRYLAGRVALLEMATADDRGLDGFLDLLELVRLELQSDNGYVGCLAVNSIAELGSVDPLAVELGHRYRSMLRTYLARPLGRAAERGEIDADLLDSYVDAAASFVVAGALAARGGADRDELDRHVDSFRRLAEHWRIA